MELLKDERKPIATIALSETAKQTLLNIRARVDNAELATKTSNEAWNAFLIGLTNRDDLKEFSVEWPKDVSELKIFDKPKDDNNQAITE